MFKNYLATLCVSGSTDKGQLAAIMCDLEGEGFDDLSLDCLSKDPRDDMNKTQWYKQGGYKQLRQAEYGTWQEQRDMEFDDKEFGTNKLHEKQKRIKEKWKAPKFEQMKEWTRPRPTLPKSE